jgi:hypothetical protein
LHQHLEIFHLGGVGKGRWTTSQLLCKCVWHLDNQTCYDDFDHKPLHLRLNINCNFVESQHTVETKKFLLKFKYD